MKKTTNQLSVFILFLFSFSIINAQTTFPRNGVADHREGLYAFTNATIYTKYNEKIENATMVIRNGKVEAVGHGIPVPKDAVIVGCNDKTIYPSFIELDSDYGMPEAKRERSSGRRGPQPLSKKEGAYSWNQALKPEFRAYEHFKTNDKKASELRKLGFGAVLSHAHDGISRGTSTLVSLGDDREHKIILEEEVGHHLSFRKGTSSQPYPSSLMGAIALLKQTYLDGDWYTNHGHKEEVNISLENWNRAQNAIQFFEVGDKLEALRAAKIGSEFGTKYIIKGGGDEYQRVNELKAINSAFIIPLNFPDAYDVEDPHDASLVTLQQMKHWELAPSNASRLSSAGIKFALTTAGLSKKSDFLSNVRKAIETGLTEEDALKALTQTPADLMKVSDRLGSLEKGKIANFIITDGDIFDKKTKIYHNWVQGKAHILKSVEQPALAGYYGLTVNGQGHQLTVKEDGDKYKMTMEVNDSTSIIVKNKIENGRIVLSFTPEDQRSQIRLSGTAAQGYWSGTGQDTRGNWVTWNAVPRRPAQEDISDDSDDKKERGNQARRGRTGAITYPFMAYGWETKPTAKTYLLKNATVWTCESEGILENADVLIQNGKIAQVGQNLRAAGATEIDATGKHITPGIIDEHTHIGASRGINEGTQASSAEVSIGDVINSEDINIYRQLSGGVVAAQVLHGSANPIGGQSGLIKFRWGFAPEEMKIKNADGFIKFALGENVKQSNRSDAYRSRFPQTRMGVEGLYEDYFTRAAEYGKLKKSGKPYRKDLDLETILEIIEQKRFISCHSYVQSEINMLMKVAEKHGFTINTFTHILEGYKVADIMAKHGAGGSSFSDWWAYKFEVYNAIPYNGAMMHEQGVTVAFNSDDAEMARRLNQEAAKAVLFGGVSEEEALKFVTINPAKLLHLDDRMGSLKPGKDGDVVIWSDNPLSVYAKADMTFVDGIKFFDRADDLKMREQIKRERNRLIQKMLAVKKGGGKMQKPFGRRGHHYHCDDVDDEMH